MGCPVGHPTGCHPMGHHQVPMERPAGIKSVHHPDARACRDVGFDFPVRAKKYFPCVQDAFNLFRFFVCA